MTESKINQECAESDSTDEEVEPKLKYVRMSNDLQDILLKDAASCIAVHPKFVCLGFHWGTIHLLDHQGNNIRGNDAPLCTHTVSVNQISIDKQGEHIASCSDDGKVFIVGLYTSEHDHRLNTGRLVRSVALDPDYVRPGSASPRLMVGDDKLSLYEKTFTSLGRMKPTMLCQSEGLVGSVAWCGRFVAWSSSIGVRVYDVEARCSLGLIQWEGSSERFRCNLRWSADGHSLLIGWVDTVRICAIRRRVGGGGGGGGGVAGGSGTGHDPSAPDHLVDPVSTFRTDFHISGVAGGPEDNQLVLLGVPKERSADGKSLRPQLHVIDYRDSDYSEVCTDSLSLRGYQEWQCNDYHLEALPGENRYFIVAPKDIVVASPYDPDDRVQWLVQHGRYEDALSTVRRSGSAVLAHTEATVGAAYLDHLLALAMWEDAARLCLRVFGRDRRLWQEHIYKFARVHRLRAVSPYLPQPLDPHIYEMVLYEYLKLEPRGFLALVREWRQPGLYNTAAVVNAVLEHLLVCDADRAVLMEALAVLYGHEGRYDKALAMYLKLGHPDVFALIERNGLHRAIGPATIVDLMRLDPDRTVDMLLAPAGAATVAPGTVVEALAGHEDLLHRYLDALDRRDPREAGPHHGRMVRLYAVFARDKLLPFLKRSDQYPIQEALDTCQQRRYYPEMVYLLGRIGDTREALELINTELGDVQQALSFCQEHDDRDLWADLIRHSLDKPDLITFLLPRVGGHVDPRVLVHRMADGMRVPGLRTALIDMLRQCNLQVGIQEGCQKILVSDYFRLHQRLVRTQQRGLCVSEELVCGACHRRLVARPAGLVVYNCRHTFHEQCLALPVQRTCSICHPVAAGTTTTTAVTATPPTD